MPHNYLVFTGTKKSARVRRKIVNPVHIIKGKTAQHRR
jgi:hypothetical protein